MFFFWKDLVIFLVFTEEITLKHFLFIHVKRNQVNFLVYGQDSKKKKKGRSVGRQNKNNIIWFLVSVFF